MGRLLTGDGREAIGESASPLPATGGALDLAGVLQGGKVLAGSKGTVADVSCGSVSLRLDDPLPGAEEWDNEIVWGDGVGRNFWEDVERLSPGDDPPQERATNDEAGWLVEWDGGWETAATPEAAGKIVEAKIAEWGDVDRDDFRIVPNVPPPEDLTGRAT